MFEGVGHAHGALQCKQLDEDEPPRDQGCPQEQRHDDLHRQRRIKDEMKQRKVLAEFGIHVAGLREWRMGAGILTGLKSTASTHASVTTAFARQWAPRVSSCRTLRLARPASCRLTDTSSCSLKRAGDR